MHLRSTAGALATVLACALVPAAGFGTPAAAAVLAPATTSTTITLPGGGKITYDDSGAGTLASADGKTTRAFPVPHVAGRTGLGQALTPDKSVLIRRAQAMLAAPATAGRVLVGLTSTSLTAKGRSPDAKVNAALTRVHADHSEPIPELTHTYVVHVQGTDAATAAATLAGTAGVAFAQPDAPVTTMDAGGQAVPEWAMKSPATAVVKTPADNAGVATSEQSYLNANGVNAMGAFADTDKLLHQLPGTGEIITNVSIGDLTDQAMADGGDSYVQQTGPNSVIENGRRYLDFPSLPLIPAWVASNDGTLDATGSAEVGDPYLGEVLLDFSMMAPLPHAQQRAGALGSGATDLLGIAPGAQYRLVVPKEASAEGIAAAFLAAARQKPKPNVITASLGFGGDSIGYAGRYLEDDPVLRAVITKIVASGIAVAISSNDGTRLGLPVSVGPDGGSTATDRAGRGDRITGVGTDLPTTAPSVLPDSGSVAVGATTTDDTLTAAGSATGSYPTTRYNGFAAYSSGFGSRIDIAAPGDNLPSLEHVCASVCTSPQAVEVVLNGGTSASAPMVAATMADVLQAGRATGRSFTPAQLRDILTGTGRKITQTPQTDQALTMGTQLDVTAAVESVLAKKFTLPTTATRLSVAERQEVGSLGGEFVEQTDPDAIDLAGPPDANGEPTGENAISPITFGLDLTGVNRKDLKFRLKAGSKVLPADGPSLRLTPQQLGVSSGPLKVTFEAYRGATVVAAASRTLTFLAGDGTYAEALAPAAPGSVALGKPVTVSYDLTGVRNVDQPQLVVSSVGHWTPTAGDLFEAQYTKTLTALKGTVTIPAAAFAKGGGGLYGLGIIQQTLLGVPFYGQFRAIRIGAAASARPAAPTLGVPADNAVEAVKGDKPVLAYDVRDVAGATGAVVEFSAPGPTLYGSLNTFTNANGSGRDDDGFNNPSLLFTKLPATHGTTKLDLAALKVPDALDYSIRVLATRGGKPIGQASPTAFLQYDESELVTAGSIQGFDVTGDTQTLATAIFDDATYALDDTSLVPVKDGALGTPYAESTDGTILDDLIGTDPGLKQTVTLARPMSGDTPPAVRVFDSGTGKLVHDIPFDHDGTLYETSAEVDAARHRLVATTFDPVLGLSQLWPVDLTTGTMGAPLTLTDANIAYRAFGDITVDPATGLVFVATTGTQGPCLSGRVSYAIVRVDLDAHTVSPSVPIAACAAGIAADGHGHLHVLTGAAQPYGSNSFPDDDWKLLDETTLKPVAGPVDLGGHGGAWPVYDAVNDVVLVAQLYGTTLATDNNAMSEVDVLDPATGAVRKRITTVNLMNSTEATTNFDFTTHRGLQIDPATRTAYVTGPYADQLERFTY
jgi:hypothetical protein